MIGVKTLPLTKGADGHIEFDKVAKPMGASKYVHSKFTDLIVSLYFHSNFKQGDEVKNMHKNECERGACVLQLARNHVFSYVIFPLCLKP
jgi:hypothetical protein